MDGHGAAVTGTPAADLDRFFSPRHVAVIGATQDPAKIGGRIVHTLVAHGFSGAIYPVNPSHNEIAGLKSYASVSALPGPVDLALVAVPAPKVPDVLESCARAGIRRAAIYSSGFSEAGEDGTALHRRLGEICERTGIRVAGPNTEGFYNIIGRTAATFNSAIDIDKGDLDASPHIAIVSQSGGLGFAFFNKGRRDDLVFSHIFSVGNQVDLEIADYVRWLLEQERVQAILMYVESLVDPPRFLTEARRAAELGKPIVMIKIGRSEAGRRAAGSHTGAMVGPAAVVDAALEHHGIIRADDQDALLNVAAALVHNPLPAGNRVGIVSVSGGTAAWLADACVAAGLEVPQLDAERRARIAACIPSFGASDNPVDVTAQASDGFLKALAAVGEAPYIDGVIIAVNFATERRLVKEGRGIADWARRAGKPVLIYSYAIPSERSRELMRELRLHCFTSLQGCVRGFRALVDYARFQRRRTEERSASSTPGGMPLAARDLLDSTNGVLCEYEAKQLLSSCGVRVPREALARSAEEAVAHARELGYAVALKIQSPDISHKTEAGGVRLGLEDAESVRAAFDEIVANARAYQKEAELRGVLVQKMAPPGRELIAGIVNRSDYGPMVMVGLGGIYAEVFDDTTLVPAPFSHATAHDMLARLRGARLLTGVRGEPPCDVEAMADFLVRLSRLAWDARDMIVECDVNPVLVHAAGDGITVVDALAIKKS